jgi:hypothetical protein
MYDFSEKKNFENRIIALECVLKSVVDSLSEEQLKNVRLSLDRYTKGAEETFGKPAPYFEFFFSEVNLFRAPEK